ncbi:DNA-binding protein [Pinirhizobacter soli]|uniref:helix-turn-helix domain-containing transcriptional regulator n=1 Tax=Pinirhizobacter soli TaxID=2786953 RepID=UPI00202A4131|nr:hypothetical protein [Pinirhizobacter soli]
MTTNFTRFDAAEFLDSEELIAAYLPEALAENDPAQIITALGAIARARGMTQQKNSNPFRNSMRFLPPCKPQTALFRIHPTVSTGIFFS